MLKDIILLSAGLIVGGMNAIAGGGTLLGFPVLLALGVPALAANASSNLIVLPGNIAASVSYRHYLKRVPRSYLLLILPAVVGAAVGATILKHTSFRRFDEYVPWLMVFAVCLFIFQPLIYKSVHNHIHGNSETRHKLGPIVIMGILLLPLAVYGGYFGAGLGFIMLAFLGFTGLRDHIHRMNALKMLLTVFVSATTLVCLLNAHLIDWHAALIMGSGNFIGGIYGAKLAQKVSSHSLRLVVIAIGILTAVVLIVRK